MVKLLESESRIIEFLLRNFMNRYNINQVSRNLDISPRGSHKTLKKLEREKILASEKIGNGIFYRINFENDFAIKLSELVLTEKKLSPAIEVIAEDLQQLKPHSLSAIVFGSIIRKPKKAQDVDVLIVLKKSEFKKVDDIIKEINKISSKKIHPVIQTKNDMLKNVKNNDKVILKIIREGIVLWGWKEIVDTIKEALAHE